jgi:hypothetical protein
MVEEHKNKKRKQQGNNVKRAIKIMKRKGIRHSALLC